jgi:hypothetical protein
MTGRTAIATLSMALSLACGGCSFLFVDGPPDRHERLLYFDCTSTAGPAVADGTMAGLTGLVAIGSAQEADESSGVATSLVTSGIFASSMIYGIVQARSCNEAKGKLRVRLMELAEQEAMLRALAEAEQDRRVRAKLSSRPRRTNEKAKPSSPLPAASPAPVPAGPPPAPEALPAQAPATSTPVRVLSPPPPPPRPPASAAPALPPRAPKAPDEPPPKPEGPGDPPTRSFEPIGR